MRIRLLGAPLVVTEDSEIPIRSARQGVVLGSLALRPGQDVPLEALMSALWDDDPPPSARNAVHVHVSGLRRLVGHHVVESSPEGYRLPQDATTVDATVFRDATHRADALMASHQWLAANRTYRSALALWQGTALAGLGGGWASSQREALDRTRLVAWRGRFRSDLELGQHLAVADEIQALLQEEPYDEDLTALLMLALYRSGHVVEALAAYGEMRRRLVDDLGVEPGSALADLHRSMLRRDPALNLDPGSAVLTVPNGVRRRSTLVGRALDLTRLEELVYSAAGPITLVGIAGVGKSRLAAELTGRMQAELPAGAAVLDCEHLTELDNVPGLIATQLGLDLLGDPMVALRDIRGLLVLDGVRPEQHDHAGLVELVDSLSLQVVATAHRPCGWAYEQIVPVRPLEIDSSDGHPSPATELLLLRAAAAGASPASDVSDAAACAWLLDGIPLALELAAPRAVLGFAELRADLERSRQREPAGLRLSFTASLHGRDEAQLRLLNVFARCGGPIDTAWLQALPTIDPHAVIDALAALVRDGLVREVTGAQDAVMFELLGGVRAEVLATGSGDDQWARAVVIAHDISLGPGRVLLSVLPTVEMSRRRAALVPSARHALLDGLKLGMYAEAARIAYAIGELTTPGGDVAMGRVWQQLSRPAVLADLPPPTRLVALIGTGDWTSENAGSLDLMKRVADEAVAVAHADCAEGDVAVALTKHLAWCYVNGLTCPVDLDHALLTGRTSGDPLAQCATELFVACIRADAALLRAALSDARRLGHAGLTALALANLAEMQLAMGNAESAADLASESLGLYAAMRVPLMQRAMAACLSTARALSGSSADLGRVADMVSHSWENESPRLVTDVLLKLGCGFQAGGSPDLAARALGVYHAYRSSHDLDIAEDEQRLIDQWLPGVGQVRPQGSLPDEIEALVTAARA